jgi:hypothetical protein
MRVPDEGREPFRERQPEAREFAMGDNVPTQGEAPRRNDQDICHDVETALFYDDAVSSLTIKVGVRSGIVTLDGTVESDLAKRLASQDAWQVAGVRGVEDHLQVNQTPTPSRAAGQDETSAKPPLPIMGQPPSAAQNEGQTARTSEGQAGQSEQSGPGQTPGRQPTSGERGQTRQSGRRPGF